MLDAPGRSGAAVRMERSGARPKPGEVSAHRLPSGLPSSPPGARCKGVAGLSACRQTSLARRVSGVDGDDLPAPTTHQEHSVQVLRQHLQELHVCMAVKEDDCHDGAWGQPRAIPAWPHTWGAEPTAPTPPHRSWELVGSVPGQGDGRAHLRWLRMTGTVAEPVPADSQAPWISAHAPHDVPSRSHVQVQCHMPPTHPACVSSVGQAGWCQRWLSDPAEGRRCA